MFLYFVLFFFSCSVQNQTYWLVHDFNPDAQEAETGGLQIQGQPGLYSKILSSKPKWCSWVGEYLLVCAGFWICSLTTNKQKAKQNHLIDLVFIHY